MKLVKLVTKVRTIFDRVNSVCIFLAIVLLIYPMVTISADALMRYLLSRPQKWVSETTELCLPLITFLGTAWLLRRDEHVKMDIVINRLSPRPLAVVNIITSILGAIISLTLVWYGVKVSWEHFQMSYFTPLLEIPTAPLLAIIPIGSFLLFIQFLIRIFEYPRR